MGHLLHARARTTPEVRRERQNSQESLMTLAARYSVNPKTLRKWRKRDYVHDAPMGPKGIRCKSLSQVEEAGGVTFRVFTQLALDDCLYSLREGLLNSQHPGKKQGHESADGDQIGPYGALHKRYGGHREDYEGYCHGSFFTR